MIKTITIECSLGDLMDVLNATGNPKVATDILNGMYEKPSYPAEIIGRFNTTKNDDGTETREPVIYKALSHDPFTDIITYESPRSPYRNESMGLKEWLHLDGKHGSPYAMTVADDCM